MLTLIPKLMFSLVIIYMSTTFLFWWIETKRRGGTINERWVAGITGVLAALVGGLVLYNLWF